MNLPTSAAVDLWPRCRPATLRHQHRLASARLHLISSSSARCQATRKRHQVRLLSIHASACRQGRKPPGHGEQTARLHRLQEAIEHASHVLSAVGPDHGLHPSQHAASFEDLPFYEAVKKGAQIFGCHPYICQKIYRDAPGASGGSGSRNFRQVPSTTWVLGPARRSPVSATGWAFSWRYPNTDCRQGQPRNLSGTSPRRMRCGASCSEVSSAVRARASLETRRWVVRDLRGGTGGAQNGAVAVPLSASLVEMLHRLRRIQDRELDRR